MRINISRDYSPVHPREVYRFMFVEVDICKAWRIIAGLSDKERAERAGQLKPPKGLLDVHYVDVDKAMDADLTVPLLLGRFISQRTGEVQLHPIDGYHRIYKAVKMRKRLLPVFYLTVEETLACRLDKGAK